MITVSIVIPCFNEREYIERCVLSCTQQVQKSIPFAVEVIVVDGMSNDGTREVLRKLVDQDSSIFFVDNPQKVTPIALNLGIQRAKGHWIMILGAHAELNANYLSIALETLQKNETIDCIGGIIESSYANGESEAIGLAQTSPFGVGNAYFRTGVKSGFVDTVAFGMYKAQALKKIGGFDDELVRNQDDELNYRWIKNGFTIFLEPTLLSKYYVRGSLKKLFRQYFQYGYWKVYVNKKHKAVTTLRQLVPFAFVGFCFATPLLFFMLPYVAIPYFLVLGVYMVLGWSTAASVTKQNATTATVFKALVTLHLSYGLGYWKGIFQFFILGKKPPKSAEVTR
jgi:glycosyltransferase involved in cell wall biosynthesis